jgi:hypothetical protein
MPMRVLIDECLPRKLKRELGDHETKSVPEMGWAGKKNGELLRLMTGQFDAFVTADQNLNYQQNLKNTSIGVVVLAAKSNRLPDLLPLVPKLKEVLNIIQSGEVTRIEAK